MRLPVMLASPFSHAFVVARHPPACGGVCATRHYRLPAMLASPFSHAFVMARHPPTCGVCRRYAPFPSASHVRLAILSCIRGCAASFCLWRCRRMAPSSRVAASLNVSLRQRPRSGRSLRSPRASSPASSRIAVALTHNASACHARLAILSCIRDGASSSCLWSV